MADTPPRRPRNPFPPHGRGHQEQTMASILIKSSAGREELELRGLAVFVGRDRSNDVVSTEVGMSRDHCVIEPTRDGWQVRDLGSRNGTAVSGRPVTTHRLQHGDRIRCGAIEIRFMDESAVPPVPPPAGVPIPGMSPASSSARAPRVRWSAIIAVAAVLVVAGAGALVFAIVGRDPSGGGTAGATQAKPAELWYLRRAAHAAIEGPLDEGRIRREYRWDEIPDEAIIAKAGGSEWMPIGETPLASGYGASEPRTAEEVPLDLEPVDFARQIIDFRRHGLIDAAVDLEVRLMDIDAVLESSGSSLARVREFLRDMLDAMGEITAANRKIHAAVREAHAKGKLADTAEDVMREKLKNAKVELHPLGPKLMRGHVGDKFMLFVRTSRGWKVDFAGAFRDPTSGELNPLIVAGFDSAEAAEFPPEFRAALVSMRMAPKIADRVIPYVERGCFRDFEEVNGEYLRAMQLAVLQSSLDEAAATSDPALMVLAEELFEAACARKEGGVGR